MKKVFLVAMVLITAFCSAFSKNANSSQDKMYLLMEKN